MGKFILGAVLGTIAGGVITFLLFVGVPGSSQTPGTPIQPPDPSSQQPSARIVLDQDLFNGVLATIFREIKEPAFPLAGAEMPEPGYSLERANMQEGGQCDGVIRILAEGSGVRSGLNLENGRISAPLAFTGSYNSAFGCLRFSGWTQANLELRFDKEQQAVFGRVNVETVNLDGINPLLAGLVTPLVQSTINTRVNPIPIIHPGQLSVDMPIASTGGKLHATVEDVRADVKDNALYLHIVYNFTGSPTL